MKGFILFFVLGLYTLALYLLAPEKNLVHEVIHIGTSSLFLLLALVCLLRKRRNGYQPLSQAPHDEDAIRRSIEIQKSDTYNLYTLHELPNSKKYVVIDCKAGRGLYSRENARVIFEPRWREIKFENGVFIITPMLPTGNGGPEGDN
jgi:hypothetical protein